jgi:osomolarity two-component system sensor histidine kinase NIK1
VTLKQTYDCILIDCNKTAQWLRESERYKYTPLVMLTPHISVSFKNALEDGISSYMTTPCQAIDLGNALIPALEGRAAPLVSKNSKSLNILLAEDNALNQRLAVQVLEKYNHKVKVANNGLEAFELAKQSRYDVILMDLQMPIMVGLTQSCMPNSV